MTDSMLPHGSDGVERDVTLTANRVTLEGTLGVPQRATGLVLFAHGSGSSRFSARNRYVAREHMRATVRLEIVPAATHLFEEPGALEDVARLARDWFTKYLRSARTATSEAQKS